VAREFTRLKSECRDDEISDWVGEKYLVSTIFAVCRHRRHPDVVQSSCCRSTLEYTLQRVRQTFTRANQLFIVHAIWLGLHPCTDVYNFFKVATPGIFVWDSCSPEVLADEVLQKLKQFADIVYYRFWLQKRSNLKILHNLRPDSWPLCFMVGELSDILGSLRPSPCLAPLLPRSDRHLLCTGEMENSAHNNVTFLVFHSPKNQRQSWLWKLLINVVVQIIVP